jgi:FHS family L-fucose permease-like MFS transporter
MTKDNFFRIEDKKYLTAWVLVTACFALWGFANNVTTPMVNAFSKIFRISTTEASLVPVVFNLGYFCLAFPAAIFIQKYSYKWGIVLGLALYAAGALFFIPARWIGAFYPFLTAYFVLTCGLSFLETSCNPYIYSLGSKPHAIQRLNAAQAFNALGSVAGMLIAMAVQARINPMENYLRMRLPQQQFDIIKDHDLGIMIQPYIYIGAIVVIMLVLIVLQKMPKDTDIHTSQGTLSILRGLMKQKTYREGVIAEFCYVGAQVCCWTYIIQYGLRVFTAEGMTEQAAEVLAQQFNIVALAFFALGRFVCTSLMRHFSPSRMMAVMGIVAIVAVLGVILFTDRNGLYCLVIVSACMSLMFPTIYGIALIDVEQEHIKIAGAGLIMAILGGSFFPPIQAIIIQWNFTVWGLPHTNVSFIIPLLCLGVVVWYGHRSFERFHLSE